MREQRHKKILQIIEQFPITTQEELLKELKKDGIPVTQATVSRDIKYLRLVKTLDKNGVYIYNIMQSTANEEISKKFISLFKETVTSIEVIDNIICVKCYTGMAGATCATFDAMDFKNAVGTIAGDDTFIVLVRQDKDAEELKDLMQQYLESKK